jgi:hypothetical protein
MFSTGALIWALTLLNLIAASCALWAAITARSSLKALRRKLAERSTRSLRQLDATLTEHASTLSSLSSTMRRLSSRSGMQALRERRRGESDSSTSLQHATKAQLRLMLHQGKARTMSDADSARLNGGASAAETATDDD